MAKIICAMGFVLSSVAVFPQFKAGFTRNLNINLPYTPLAQAYIDKNQKQINGKVHSAYISYAVINKTKFTWSTGITYKHVNLEVKNVIKAYYEYQWSVGQYELIVEDLDLIQKSHSIGFVHDFSWNVHANQNMRGEVGVSGEVYLWERYWSRYYYYEDGKRQEHEIYPDVAGFKDFMLSSANASIFYRFIWQPTDKLSLGTRFSFGTNLYSDWDQFSKYAWIGLGLEIGFNTRKAE